MYNTIIDAQTENKSDPGLHQPTSDSGNGTVKKKT